MSFLLCMCCGSIEEETLWTYWQSNPDEATEEARPWVISKPGEGDPMALCPICGWQHRDTDDGSGFYFGTRGDVEADRARELVDFEENWKHVLDGPVELDRGMLTSLAYALREASES